MSLRLGFQLLTLGLFVVAAVPVWFAVHAMAEGIVEQWAVRYAEKQVLYDKSRMLQPILREVALSRQLADSAVLIDWAGDPDNPDKTRDALEELERFRVNFQDQNYFVGLLSNGRYYHNNRTNDYIVEPLRYVLDPAHSKDAWFYDLINQGRDVHINVNPDPELGLTKLWIDVLLRDQSGVLGVVGTGLDLSDFTVKVVDLNAPGITSLIVNHMGAIQVHRNHALIDFGSISKKGERPIPLTSFSSNEKIVNSYRRPWHNSSRRLIRSSPGLFRLTGVVTWPVSPICQKSTGTKLPCSILMFFCP